MAPSSSSMILVAGSALLVAAAATQFFPSSSSSEAGKNSSSRALTEVEDDNDDDDEFDPDEVITADLVAKIFDRLHLEMQSVVAQLMQQIQQLQMSGQQIPEAQLRILIKAEFERALTVKQGAIFDEFDVDADCLEEATWEFMENREEYPKVVRSVERFQKLYETISGESVVGKLPGQAADDTPVEVLPPDQLVAAAEKFFAAATNTMKEIVDSFKAEGKDVSNRAVGQEIQMKFSSVAGEAGEAALEDMGISMKTFQKSIEKYSNDPKVNRTLAMLQMKQQQDMMAMGIGM